MYEFTETIKFEYLVLIEEASGREEVHRSILTLLIENRSYKEIVCLRNCFLFMSVTLLKFSYISI